MATIKSTLVSNYEASPPVMNSSQVDKGKPRIIRGTISVAAADNDADVFALCPLRSSDLVDKIEIWNDAITNGTDYNLGIYSAAAVVDVDENLFADAVSMASARVAPLDVTFHTQNITAIGKPLWEALGLTSDPKATYYLCLTAVTVGTVQGDISFRVSVIDGI